ncbi:MAG: hypothetical protein AAGD05_05775 [Bacteroidota bacterium]
MRKRNESLEEAVEQTLGIADRIQRQRGNPYLSTRVLERLRKAEHDPSLSATYQPLWKVAVVAVLLLVNSLAIWQMESPSSEPSILTRFAQEYGLEYDDSSVYSNY